MNVGTVESLQYGAHLLNMVLGCPDVIAVSVTHVQYTFVV